MNFYGFALVAVTASLFGSSVAIDDCSPDSPCTAECFPQCGSNGRTYGNPCALIKARCTDASLTKVADGVCPDDKNWSGQLCESSMAPPNGGGSNAGNTTSPPSNNNRPNATTTTSPPPSVTTPSSSPVPSPTSGASTLPMQLLAVAVAVIGVALAL